MGFTVRWKLQNSTEFVSFYNQYKIFNLKNRKGERWKEVKECIRSKGLNTPVVGIPPGGGEFKEGKHVLPGTAAPAHPNVPRHIRGQIPESQGTPLGKHGEGHPGQVVGKMLETRAADSLPSSKESSSLCTEDPGHRAATCGQGQKDRGKSQVLRSRNWTLREVFRAAEQRCSLKKGNWVQVISACNSTNPRDTLPGGHSAVG